MQFLRASMYPYGSSTIFCRYFSKSASFREAIKNDDDNLHFYYTATGRKIYYKQKQPHEFKIVKFFQRFRDRTPKKHSILRRLIYRYPTTFRMMSVYFILAAFAIPTAYYIWVPLWYSEEDYKKITIESRLEFYNRWRAGTGIRMFGYEFPSFSGKTLSLEDLNDPEISEKNRIIDELQEKLEAKRRKKVEQDAVKPV